MMIAFAIAAGIIVILGWLAWIDADELLQAAYDEAWPVANDSWEGPDPRTLDQLGSEQPHSGGDKTAFNHGPPTTSTEQRDNG